MKAVILAAGKSTRLYPITLEKPKCLLNISGKTILEHQIDLLNELGIFDIVVVTGYLGEQIEKVCSEKAKCLYSPDYEKTNNLHTLWHVRNELNNDFVCLFSDVVLDKSILKDCIESEKDFCLVLEQDLVPETMKAKVVDGNVVDVGKHVLEEEAEGNFIGVAKFSKKGAELLVNEMNGLVESNFDSYYVIALNELAKKGVSINFIGVNGRKWIEIDTIEDYEQAKKFIL